MLHEYGWKGVDLSSNVWPTEFDDVFADLVTKTIISHQKSADVVACLYNEFKNGNITTGDHSDLSYDRKHPVEVYMISLGENRPFVFTNKRTKEEFTIMLQPFMFLHMSVECNDKFTHKRPRFKTKKQSESFTFRFLK